MIFSREVGRAQDLMETCWSLDPQFAKEKKFGFTRPFISRS
jgi:hypothetical protein